MGFAMRGGESMHATPTDMYRASRSFERACRIDPLHAGAFYNLAKCYEAVGRFDNVREAYLQAKELDARPLRMLQAMSELRAAGGRIVQRHAARSTHSSCSPTAARTASSARNGWSITFIRRSKAINCWPTR